MILQPEMEMVARGLGKNLKVEQRQLLMNMFVSVCSEESHRSAADALGLVCPFFSSVEFIFLTQNAELQGMFGIWLFS